MLLNVKWKIIKLLDKYIGEKLWYLELGKIVPRFDIKSIINKRED